MLSAQPRDPRLIPYGHMTPGTCPGGPTAHGAAYRRKKTFFLVGGSADVRFGAGAAGGTPHIETHNFTPFSTRRRRAIPIGTCNRRLGVSAQVSLRAKVLLVEAACCICERGNCLLRMRSRRQWAACAGCLSGAEDQIYRQARPVLSRIKRR